MRAHLTSAKTLQPIKELLPNPRSSLILYEFKVKANNEPCVSISKMRYLSQKRVGKHMTIASQAFKNAATIIGINLLFILANRAMEAFLLLQNHYLEGIVSSVLLGTMFDLSMLSLVSVLVFVLFLFTPSGIANIIKTSLLIISFLFHLLHLPLLTFFIQTLTPLDRMLFANTLKELVFTIRTAGINLILVSGMLVLYGFIFWMLVWALKRINIAVKHEKRIASAVIILAISSFWLQPGSFGFKTYHNIYIQENKSVYFYKDAIGHFASKVFSSNDGNEFYSNALQFQEYFDHLDYVSVEYPFLNVRQKDNPWGVFFPVKETPPNIIMIIVEGLNNDFLLPDDGVILMPFLDSLKRKSLYWDHFLGTGEMSYAVLPSMIGSLPHGEIGFTMLNDAPLHLSLINRLRPHGYQTGFFYGQGGYFHQKEAFLKRNGIDLMVDKTDYDQDFRKIIDPHSNYFWGYHDQDLFRNYFRTVDHLDGCQRFDIFFTATMHSPFAIENEDFYHERYNEIINEANLSSRHRTFYNKYKKYLRTLLFTDDALHYFFNEYEKTDCFENTIFIITGDHPMSEVPIANQLKKYHVPLIVYSPMIIKPKTIGSVSGQFEVYPAILDLLEINFGVDLCMYTQSFGLPAATRKEFAAETVIPLMRRNRLVDEILYENYFLTKDKLYKVEKGFRISPLNHPAIKAKLQKMLEAYNNVNNDMVRRARLMPDSIFLECTGL